MQTGKINSKGRAGSGMVIVAMMSFMLLFAGCDRSPNDPGWDFFPDMAYSPAYRTWSENPVFEDGMTMLPPVEGTIPRNMIPFQYERTIEDQVRAGQELVNPFTATDENIERGRKSFTVYCMNCHGERGDGLGHLFTSGRYLVPPSSLVDERVTALPDGSIFHTVSLGYGVMAEHASLILPEDRWKIILYLRRELQDTGNFIKYND